MHCLELLHKDFEWLLEVDEVDPSHYDTLPLRVLLRLDGYEG